MSSELQDWLVRKATDAPGLRNTLVLSPKRFKQFERAGGLATQGQFWLEAGLPTTGISVIREQHASDNVALYFDEHGEMHVIPFEKPDGERGGL